MQRQRVSMARPCSNERLCACRQRVLRAAGVLWVSVHPFIGGVLPRLRDTHLELLSCKCGVKCVRKVLLRGLEAVLALLLPLPRNA